MEKHDVHELSILSPIPDGASYFILRAPYNLPMAAARAAVDRYLSALGHPAEGPCAVLVSEHQEQLKRAAKIVNVQNGDVCTWSLEEVTITQGGTGKVSRSEFFRVYDGKHFFRAHWTELACVQYVPLVETSCAGAAPSRKLAPHETPAPEHDGLTEPVVEGFPF